MAFDAHNLRRYDPAAVRAPEPAAEEGMRPPSDSDIALLGAGNSGEAVTLRCQALGFNDAVFFAAGGLNNDRLAPRPMPVRRPDGTITPLELAERLVLDGENPRDLIRDYGLLDRRYQHLLRGIPVLETFPKAGAGGHGHPVISALDIDLSIDAVLRLLRRMTRRLRDEPPALAGQSDVQRLLAQSQRRQDVAREKRIVVIGGGAGAMGNAAHQLLPYLIRMVLREQGITAYQLWGVVLGPRAFTGLTPQIKTNYRALIEAFEHMSRHGQRRAYLNDVTIDIQQPPYDRVFLFDDPTLPGEGARVSEAELESFLDRAALNLYLLLRGTVWQTVASHIANDDGVARADGRLRYLNTLHGVAIGADRAQIADVLATRLSAQALEQLVHQFEG